MPGDLPEPKARSLREADYAALGEFRCSTGAWYEDDVEEMLVAGLRPYLEWRHEEMDTRAILLEDRQTEEILAVGVHEEADQIDDEGSPITGTYLVLGAVALLAQGKTLDIEPLDEDQKPVTAGRYLLQALLDDIPERRPGLAYAVAAKENERGRRLCKRAGLSVEREDPDPRFVQCWEG